MPSRRREPRYPSNFVVTLDRGAGLARNVSASGIFFETPVRFEPGAPVRVTIAFEPAAGRPLKMYCQGRVVHVEKLDERFGVGARIEHLELRPGGEEGDENR